MPRNDFSQYMKQVRTYYDRWTPILLELGFETYQAGMLKGNTDEFSFHSSNLFIASRAGIQPGNRVLDAGCGCCGPSVDIAQSIDVHVDGITLSPLQADVARKLVKQAGLSDRIQVYVGDYHCLPVAAGTFDIVLFLESIGYSYAPQKLFADVYRVLSPGGSIYIKDVFCKEHPLSDLEQKELSEFDQLYCQYRSPRMSETVRALSAAGFQDVEYCNIDEMVSIQHFIQAMIEYRFGFPLLTAFGKHHFRHFDFLPILFGEIKARKQT